MKRIFIILFIFFAGFVNSQERFTSNKFNFSIAFPDDWDVSTKNKSYVVEAYENDFIGISIIATKIHSLRDSMDIGYITIDSLQKIIEEEVKYRFNNSRVLSSGKGFIDGILAYHYFIQYSDIKEGFPAKFISFQYQFVYRKIFYSMFAVCPLESYESHEKDFNKIYATFKFLKKNK